MYDDFFEMVSSLKETREQVAFLREHLRIDLGEIQIGYEYAIERILELFGLSEEEIDTFWELSEPDIYKRKCV